MNIPHKIIWFAVQPVIVVITALIRTEFFIGPTTKGVAAIETFLFHSTKCFYKDIKNTIDVYESDIDIYNTNDVYYG